MALSCFWSVIFQNISVCFIIYFKICNQIGAISQLAQRCCDNVVTTMLLTLGQLCDTVENETSLTLSDVIKTLPQRCCNVVTTFSIGFLGHFTTDYSDFFPFIETWESSVVSGIKHTSSLFKRMLYLYLTKVHANQVKYRKFNFFTMNKIIHFFT